MLMKIQEMLNEEKWTRSTINSYTVTNFEELDALIREEVKKDDMIEVKDVCEEHLAHTRTSIIALYVSGVISLEKHLIDDTHLIQLINLFYDNRKWNIVEFLCKRVLEYGENPLALRSLAECFDNVGRDEDKYAVWERLIRIDYEEVDIIKQLAEHFEEQEDTDKAVSYFKKSLHRFINTKNFSQIKEIWLKLLSYRPDDFDNQMNIVKRVCKAINKDRAVYLLETMYEFYFSTDAWDKSINILKEILSYQPQNSEARNRLIDCYRKRYQNHSKIEDYIAKTNLNQSYRDINTAIIDFEKHISFDKGTFVFHKSWGIGMIREIQEDSIIIDFATKRNHTMALSMAVNALIVLMKNHIWVMKSVFPKEQLREKVKSDPGWALRTIILSLDNSASMKQVKAELVPSILTPNEWLSWNNNAKKLVKTDPLFGVNPERSDEFVVRESPITYEEKTLNMFKAEKDFNQKVKILREFLDNSDPETDYFSEIFSYFVNILKSYTVVNEMVVASYLLVKKLVKTYTFLNQGLELNFTEILDGIQSIDQIFADLTDAELKRAFLEEVYRNAENWDSVYKQLFQFYLSTFIIDELEDKDKMSSVIEIFSEAYDTYKERPEPFIWLVKNYPRKFWENKVKISFERILIALLHLLDMSNRAVKNKRDVSMNRKLARTISGILFDEKVLHQYARESSHESLQRIYSLIKDVDDLDPAVKIEIKHIIIERFPEFRFLGDDEQRVTTSSTAMLVTQKSYEEKQERLQTILEVEIPNNSKEIGEARLLGDLKENAEYIAGKEKQELLNITVGKLKDELDRAVIFQQNSIDASKISYGTKVTLENMNSHEIEEFTILGPWESNPSKNIISYLAPFGARLLNHTVGEEFGFIINERDYTYKVVRIEAVDLG